MAAFWRSSLGIWTMLLRLLSGPLLASAVDPVDLISSGLNLDHGLNQDLALDSAQFWGHGSPQGSPGSLGFSSDELLSRSDSGGAVIRRKRNILFPNGVKMCTRETYEQVVHNHLQYFYLRVCQETVWEAFKVFWDRLPEREEYRSWVNLCLNQSLSITEIGLRFSRAEEHHKLIMNRLEATVNSSGPAVSKSEDWPTQALPVEEATLIQFDSSSIITDHPNTKLDQDVDQDLDQNQKTPARISPGTSDLEIPTGPSTITFTIQQEIQEFLRTTSKSTTPSPLEGIELESNVLHFTLDPKTIPTQPSALDISPPEVEEATGTQKPHDVKSTETSTIEEEQSETKEDGISQTIIPILELKFTESPTEIVDDISQSQTTIPKIGVGDEVSTAKTKLEQEFTSAEVKPTIFTEKDPFFVEPTIKEELKVTAGSSIKETVLIEEEIMETFTKLSLEDKTGEKEEPSPAVDTELSTDLVLEEKIVLVPSTDEEIMTESPSLEEELNRDVETLQEDIIDKDEENAVEMMTKATAKPSRKEEVLVDKSEEEEQLLMPTQDEISQENIDLKEDILQPTLARTEATDIHIVSPIVTKIATQETVEEDEKLVEITTEIMTKPTQVEEFDIFTPTVWVISEELPDETGEGTVETGTTKIEFTKVEPLEISPTDTGTAEVSPTSTQSEKPEQRGATEVLWTEKPTTPEVRAETETEEKEPDQEVELKTEEKEPVQEVELKPEEKEPDQEVELKTEEKEPVQEVELKPEEKEPDQEVELKPEEKEPDQEVELKTEEKEPDQEVELKPEEKEPDQEVELKPEEKEPDQEVELKTEEKEPDQEVELKTEEKEPDQEVELKPEEKEPDQEVELKPEEKEPDQEVELKPEEKEPDQEVELKPEEKEPDQEVELKPEEKEPDQEEELKPEEKEPDQEVELKTEEKEPDQEVELKTEEKEPDQEVELKTEEKEPDQEVELKTEQKEPDQEVDLKPEEVETDQEVDLKTEEKEPDQEVELKTEQKEPDQELDLKPEKIEPDQELDLKLEEVEPDQELDLKTEQKEPDQEVDLKPEEIEPDQELDLKAEEKEPDQEVDLKEKTEQKEPDQELDLKTEEKEPDQEVDLKPEKKEPDQEVDLKPEEKEPDQEVDLKPEEKELDQELDLKPEGKEPDQEVDLKPEEVEPDQELDLKPEEKEPDQEVDLKPEEKEPDQEVDLKPEEKEPDQEVDLKPEEVEPDQELDLKSEEKELDQEVDLKPEEKEPDQEVDLKPEEKEPDQEVDLIEKTEQKEPAEDVDQTEAIERPGTEKPQQTTTYVVEYNNGNFVHVTEPNLDLDLLQNNFGLEDEDTLGNEIGVEILRPLRPLKDQVLELNLRLREETYSDALRNPSSLQYQRLERVFIRKIIDAFERLPGFKNAQVVEFRPQKDLERGLVVSVHYAVTLEVDTGGVSNDTLDFIALQSNFVEKNYPQAEQPTVLYTITDFGNYITEALHIQINENSLPSAKPTTLSTDDFDNMDNILAAEKPPDAPTHESETEVFLKKEDFLFDTFDFSKPKDEPRVSENDVIAIDEATVSTAAADHTTDATTTRPTTAAHDAGAVENEDFLVSHWNQDSDQDLGLRPGLSLDDISGSGFSGDGSVLFNLDSDLGKVGPINPEVLPDLETSEDDLDEIPSASTETAQIPPKIQEFTKSEEFEPTEVEISPKMDGVTVVEVENSESQSVVEETAGKVDQFEVSTTESLPNVKDFEATKANLVTKVEEISQTMTKTETATMKFVPEIVESSLPQTTEQTHKFTEFPNIPAEGTITFETFESTEVSRTDQDFFFSKPTQTVTEMTPEKPEVESGDIVELEKVTEKTDLDITATPIPKSVEKADHLDLAELESLTNPPETVFEEKDDAQEMPNIQENFEIITIKPTDSFEAEKHATTVSPTERDEREEPTLKTEMKQIDSRITSEDEKPSEDAPANVEDTKVEAEIILDELEIPSRVDVEILEEQFLGVTESGIIKTTISGLPSEDLSVDEVIAVTLPPKMPTTADTTTVSSSAVKMIEKQLLDHEVRNLNKPDIVPTEIYSEMSPETMAPKIVLESTPKMSEKEEFNIINPEIAVKPEYLTTESDVVPIFDATQAPSVDVSKTTTLHPQETTKMATTTSFSVISEPEKESPFTRISDSVPEYEDETPVSTPTLTTEPLEVIKTSHDQNIYEILSKTTISTMAFDDTTQRDVILTSPKVQTGLNIENGLTSAPTVESIEVIPENPTEMSSITTSFEPILSEITDKTDEENQIYQIEGITTLKPGVIEPKIDTFGSKPEEEESKIVPFEDFEGSTVAFDTEMSSAVVIQKKPTLSEKTQEDDLKIYSDISTVKTTFTIEKMEAEDVKLEIALPSPRVDIEAPTLSEHLEKITKESHMDAETNKLELITAVSSVLTSQTASSEILGAPDVQEELHDVLTTTSSSFEIRTSAKTVATLPPNVEIQLSSADSPTETLTEQISESEIVLPLTPSNRNILEDSKLFTSEFTASYTTQAPALKILPATTAIDDSGRPESTTGSSDPETKTDMGSKMSAKEDSSVVFIEDNLTKENVEIPSEILTVELETKMEESLKNVATDSQIVPLSPATPSIKIDSEYSNVEIAPTITSRDDYLTSAEVDSSVVLPEDNEIVDIPPLIQSSEPKRDDSKPDDGTDLVENVEIPSIIPLSEHETKTDTTVPPKEAEVPSEIPTSEPKTKTADSSQTNDGRNNTVRLFSEGFSDSPSFDVSFGLVPFSPDGSGAVPSDGEVAGSIAGASDSLQTQPERALTVFFSLRVTNMVFSQNLFNKSSAEYRRLEQRFVTLLVPFLESNLNNFQELQILNFQNGSVVVNSRVRFVTPVRRGLTTAVYMVLKDFAASAQKTMDLRIDKSSLDVESGERTDACKFLGCNRFSRCRLNPVSLEPECVCLPGYLSVDGLPCLSMCQLQPDFCKNDGKCDVVPGKGAICRCRVGENWFFRGEHCEEFVSETLVVIGAVGTVLGFLFVTMVTVYFLSKFLQQQEPEDDNDVISEEGQKWDRSRFQIPVESDSPVLAQSYRRYDDHLLDPPSYPQATPPLPMYSSAISRQEVEERLRVQELCSRNQAFNDFMQTTLFLERRGSSST